MVTDPEQDWSAGLGWSFTSVPDAPWSIWKDPEWRAWADDFLGAVPWHGTGVVDVSAEDLVEACQRYCLAAVSEALPIGLIGKWLWKGGRYAGPFAKYFARPVAERLGPRVLSRQAKVALAKRFERLVKKGDEIRPVVRGSAQSGAQVLRASQYIAIGDALNETIRVDPEYFTRRLVEEIQRRAGENPNFEDFLDLEYEEYDDMPYNRRTGQWYPARRRYGNYRRDNRRGGYGYGNYRPRRRSYRRW